MVIAILEKLSIILGVMTRSLSFNYLLVSVCHTPNSAAVLHEWIVVAIGLYSLIENLAHIPQQVTSYTQMPVKER